MVRLLTSSLDDLDTLQNHPFFSSGIEFDLVRLDNLRFEEIPFWVTRHVCLYNH